MRVFGELFTLEYISRSIVSNSRKKNTTRSLVKSKRKNVFRMKFINKRVNIRVDKSFSSITSGSDASSNTIFDKPVRLQKKYNKAYKRALLEKILTTDLNTVKKSIKGSNSNRSRLTPSLLFSSQRANRYLQNMCTTSVKPLSIFLTEKEVKKYLASLLSLLFKNRPRTRVLFSVVLKKKLKEMQSVSFLLIYFEILRAINVRTSSVFFSKKKISQIFTRKRVSFLNFRRFKYLSLILRLSLNNIFITLINNHGNVLCAFSGGRVGKHGFKRKTLPALKLMLFRIVGFLRKKRLSNKVFFFIMKTNHGYFKKQLLRSLFRKRIVINFTVFDIKKCHNGLRKRKVRNR